MSKNAEKRKEKKQITRQELMALTAVSGCARRAEERLELLSANRAALFAFNF
jgi:hypothetical protein